MIDWDKGHFTGRRALLAERDGGTSDWALVGLDIDGNVSAEGSLLYHGKKHEAGFITAAAWSPTTKRNIALAQVRAPDTQTVENLWVEIYALRELQYVKLMLPVKRGRAALLQPRPPPRHPAGEVLMSAEVLRSVPLSMLPTTISRAIPARALPMSAPDWRHRGCRTSSRAGPGRTLSSRRICRQRSPPCAAASRTWPKASRRLRRFSAGRPMTSTPVN